MGLTVAGRSRPRHCTTTCAPSCPPPIAAPGPLPSSTVLVYGYEHALAFRIEDGRITGRLSNEKTDDAWWLYRLKKTKDDRDRVKRRTLRIKGKNFVERVTYKRRKSIMVPVKFSVFTKSRFGVITKSGVITPVGVNEYSFTKLRVSLPN